ncbi:MAG: hypothetical protein KAT81_06950, partial [Syntrophobacterales bacterium]|nr:hypothetical protein [Syntrophobacterales bacterium]
DFGRHTLEVEGQRGDATLRGIISMPDRTRANTKGQFYFVNNRFIRDRLLNHSVITSYRRLIEPRRFPYVVLFIDMPASDVDINVHPAKMEVRFRSSGDVYSLVTDTLSRALSGMLVARTGFPEPSFGVSADAYRERVGDALKRYTVLSGAEKKIFNMNVSEGGIRKAWDSSGWREGEEKLPNLFNERDVPEDVINFSSLNYLGQIAGTYLAFSSDGAFILMDQHAAHERVLFEKLKASTKESTHIQGLLIPEVVSLQPGRFDLLMNNIDALRDAGLGVERYGENTILVKQVSAFLADCSLETLISDIIEEIEDTGKTENADEMKDKILTVMACKGAVKANHSLTESEVAALCEDLDSIPFAS